VQLFSSPQQKQAAKIRNDPPENERLWELSNDSTTLETVISEMAIQSRFDTFSENNTSAITEVATISKFPSNDALSAEDVFKPNIKKIGAAISKRIMPTVYGSSFFVSLVSRSFYGVVSKKESRFLFPRLNRAVPPSWLARQIAEDILTAVHSTHKELPRQTHIPLQLFRFFSLGMNPSRVV
jgi:hypothetical protein